MNFTGSFKSTVFKRHFEIVLGKMLQPERSTPNDHLLPYLRAANVLDGIFDTSDIKEMWFSPRERNKFEIRKGDLIVLEGGDVGRCALWNSSGTVWFQNSVHRVRGTKSGSLHFAAYWLQHLKSQGFFELICSKATLAHFTREKFQETPFPVVSIDTQKAIADFLDRETARIDALIEKKQRLLSLLGEKRATEILLALTLGLSRQTATKPSKINDLERIPSHWEERRLSTVCRFFQGKAHEPFFDDEGAYIAVTARFVSTNGDQAKRCSKNLSPARACDILMVMSDLPNGRALARSFLVMQNDLYAVNQRVCALTPTFGDSRFYSYQLNRNDQLLRYNDGFNQTHLKNRYFLQLTLRVPPLDEQTLIADYLDNQISKIKEIIEKTNHSIDRLREFRSSLITAAVTGQIDVTTWQRHGHAERHLDQMEESLAG